jgi:hypothetical protein
MIGNEKSFLIKDGAFNLCGLYEVPYNIKMEYRQPTAEELESSRQQDDLFIKRCNTLVAEYLLGFHEEVMVELDEEENDMDGKTFVLTGDGIDVILGKSYSGLEEELDTDKNVQIYFQEVRPWCIPEYNK